jgi:hypothetical protein
MQKPSAKYVITDTFKITGRGLTFVGYITEGSILSGDRIEFTAFNTVLNRKITGVEDSRVLSGKPNVGLLIKCENEIEIDQLRNWEFNNQTALIFKETTLNNESIINSIVPPKTTYKWWQKLFNSK